MAVIIEPAVLLRRESSALNFDGKLAIADYSPSLVLFGANKRSEFYVTFLFHIDILS